MTANITVIFPGQGSQSIGMLAELAEHYPLVTQIFAEASSVLGYDLWALCQQGPAEQLNETQYTQPALLTAGVAVWRVLQQQSSIQPRYMAGHSLGEYTALVCANALDFLTAVKLVEKRGQLMQQAVPVGEGAMAAILGLDNNVVQQVCEQTHGEVSIANFNALGQVVIAGNKSAVEQAIV
ncbi:MAG: acyltransferase domain-containing protein, partial [Gammaproteobacteria bacterium]|nr:acyltransferase domain-containing protein [Gammaproteobacteria bacterium]